MMECALAFLAPFWGFAYFEVGRGFTSSVNRRHAVIATFTFTGQLFDILENSNGSARTLSAQAATLRVTTSADTGFFTYRTIGFDAELPDVEIFNSNITSATVNGFEVFNADNVDSSIGTITINGAESFTLALNRETDLNRFDLGLFALDGSDLPTITSAGQFNQILGSADFGAGSGPLAANQRIEFNDLDQAGFTSGVPVENGTTSADEIIGDAGADNIDAGGGNDSVEGGGGNDTITGGRGKDELTGGRGKDRFEFKQGDGQDTVTDYEDGRDKFVIGLGADDFSDLTITQVGDDARITFSNVRITVEDTDANVLDANDFLF